MTGYRPQRHVLEVLLCCRAGTSNSKRLQPPHVGAGLAAAHRGLQGADQRTQRLNLRPRAREQSTGLGMTRLQGVGLLFEPSHLFQRRPVVYQHQQSTISNQQASNTL